MKIKEKTKVIEALKGGLWNLEYLFMGVVVGIMLFMMSISDLERQWKVLSLLLMLLITIILKIGNNLEHQLRELNKRRNRMVPKK